MLYSGLMQTMLALASLVNKVQNQYMLSSIGLPWHILDPIRDRVKNLQCIVKEHLLSIEPQLLAAIPPPAKRIKNNKSCSSAQPQ